MVKKQLIKYLIFSLSLFTTLNSYEIVIDESLSYKDRRYIDSLLNKSSHKEIVNNGSYIEPAMIKIKAGSFMMGSNDGDKDEKPIHRVTIPNDFYIGKYEVTVGEFRKFIDDTNYQTDSDKKGYCWTYTTKWEKKSGANWKNSGFNQTDNNPVVCVSWNDAKKYTNWLSKKTNKNYRLPTESEWEYVARAGTTTKYSFSDSSSSLGSYAWYNSNSGSKTHKVGTKKPNRWGLYDMHGNVWEWCEDWYVDNYKSTPRDGSSYNNKKSYKILRGGSWDYDANVLRSANRNWGAADSTGSDSGFRLVLSD